MEWVSAYILVRPDSSGTLLVVHKAEKLKDARYWLQYIAHAGDAVFITPKNAQYKGTGEPTYMSHLVSRGKIDYNEKQWKAQVFNEKENAKYSFSEAAQEAKPDATNASGTAVSETRILELANGKPQTLTLDELAGILRLTTKQFRVVLSDPSKWIEWESALTLMTQDMFVIAVDKGAKWPLTVTMKPEAGKGETMNYEPDMRFVVRPRTA